jgi:hypothetical protein
VAATARGFVAFGAWRTSLRNRLIGVESPIVRRRDDGPRDPPRVTAARLILLRDVPRRGGVGGMAAAS